MNDECLACKSLSGKKRISPAPPIYQGIYWDVEHAYPVKEKGWLVIVYKKHIESLHVLNSSEWYELAVLIASTVSALREVTNCEKEYVMCLAEGEGFKHIHVHVIAKSKDLAPEFKGAKIFGLLRVEPKDAVPPEEIIRFCERIKDNFKTPSI